MKNTLREQYILFLSLIKWAILASLIGIIAGLLSTLFLKTLEISISTVQSYSYYFLLLPIILFISSFISLALPKALEGQGKVIEAVHNNSSKIHIVIVPVRFFATILTIAFGGSSGKVGPCAQMGAEMASSIGEFLKLKTEDKRMLMICGKSAGFSAVFGTPIAGAIFAIEVLVLGRVLNNYLFPVLVSSIVSYKITSFFGISYHHYQIKIIQQDNLLFYIKIALSGIILDFIALLFIEILSLGNKLANYIKIYRPLKRLIGGLAITLLVFVFKSTLYLGLGGDIIDSSIQGSTLPMYAFLVKIIFVSITLSFGGSGGLITPLFLLVLQRELV